jgi:phosphoribosylformimino-5-aminoimidazole carboxamide ribotide isomerase
VIVIPSLDISDGRVVGRVPGPRNGWPVYSDDPAAVAMRWQDEGAEILHVADMDEPRGDALGDDEPAALWVLRHITDAVGTPVEFSSPVATVGAAEKVLDAGACWVVLRHETIPGDGTLGAAVQHLGRRLIVAFAAGAGEDDVLVAQLLEKAGVTRLIVRDATADGALAGPNLAVLGRIAEAVSVPTIAAGGVASLDDLRALRDLGLHGVVIGRALYEGRMTLPEAIAAAKVT